MKQITNAEIGDIARSFGFSYAEIKTIIAVETGGRGFDRETGRIIIQFEPVWYRRHLGYTPSGAWSLNKVERQDAEWKAFNSAWYADKVNGPRAAMLSTSWGLPQIMGFHFRKCGFENVDAFVNYMKAGEPQQVELLCRFIRASKQLYGAIKTRDWHTVALIYNGAKYREQAERLGIVPYNIQLVKAFKIYNV